MRDGTGGLTGLEPAQVRKRLRRATPWVLALAIVLADQITKHIVLATVETGSMVTVIEPYVQFVRVRNPGIAFGLNLGSLSRPFFIVASLAVLGVLVSLYRSTPPEERLRRIAIVVLCAGAIGNLIDRVRWSEGVVDFIRVVIWGREWPIFNVADMAVTVGAVLLGLSLLAETRPRRTF